MKFNQLVFSSLAMAIASFGIAMSAEARPASLIAQNPSSRINVRSAPTTQASTPHYGVVGDRVEVLKFIVGRDQYAWNYVKFRSGAKGWVRGDFVRYAEGMANYAVLGGSPGDRINVRSAPSTQSASPHFGMQGDVVRILTETKGKDGYIWQYVEFPSGAEGWIRGDLVRPMDEGGC